MPGTGVSWTSTAVQAPVPAAGSLPGVLADLLRRRIWAATALVVLSRRRVPAAASGRGQALHLVHVAHVTQPLYATAPAGQPGKLYVVQQAGQIVVLANGKSTSTFLDIHSLVKSGGEQGLLSMAFDPGYAKNHRFYVDYTDLNGDTRVVRYLSNGTTGIPSSAKQLLFVKDFAPNHNGGQLQFGPDGRLYWGNGDGGGEDDPNDNGQNLNRPFAKIMRLERERRRADAGSSSPTASATRGASRSTARPATSTSATSARTSGRRSTTCSAASPGIANFGWKHFEGNHVFDADDRRS